LIGAVSPPDTNRNFVSALAAERTRCDYSADGDIAIDDGGLTAATLMLGFSDPTLDGKT
jgi:hypothetical protein